LSDESGNDLGAMNEAARFAELAADDPQASAVRAIEATDALPAIAGVGARRSALESARQAAANAYRLDPQRRPENRDVLAIVSVVVLPPHQWAERIAPLEKLQGPEGGVSRYLAQHYLRTGRLEDARNALGSIGDVYGKSLLYVQAQAMVALSNEKEANRKLDAAAAIWRKNPIFRQLRFETALFLSRRPGDAVAELKRGGDGAIVLEKNDTQARLEIIAAGLDTGASRAATDAAERQCDAPGPRDELILARTCLSAMAMLGRNDAAFRLVDELYPNVLPAAGDDADGLWLAARPTAWDPTDLFMPWMASLRADPRMIPVFERLGLLGYWRKSGNWPDFCQTEPQSVCAQMKSRG
jgi:hypothetical protein